MKAESRFDSVQPLNPDGSRDGGLINTDANSPLQASEKTMGVQLALHGKVARAIVWVMVEGFTPSTVTLCRPDEAKLDA